MLLHGCNLCRLIAFGHWTSCALGHVLMTRAQGWDMLFAQSRRCALCVRGFPHRPSCTSCPVPFRISLLFRFVLPLPFVPFAQVSPAQCFAPFRIALLVLPAPSHISPSAPPASPVEYLLCACSAPSLAACPVRPGASPCARSLWNCGPQALFYTGSAGFLL